MLQRLDPLPDFPDGVRFTVDGIGRLIMPTDPPAVALAVYHFACVRHPEMCPEDVLEEFERVIPEVARVISEYRTGDEGQPHVRY